MAFHPQVQSRMPQSEINMIPLIDVMLVLLIVFIVAAPLLTHAVKIELPKANSTSAEIRPETIQISIQADGSLYWNGVATTEAALADLMREAARNSPQPEIHLRADVNTTYGILARVMAQSAGAGLGKIGFVNEPVKAPAASPQSQATQ